MHQRDEPHSPKEGVTEAEALHEVARDLASAHDLPAVLRRIADLARLAAAADSCYLERIDFERQEVEVVATAGTAAPVVGARIPYPGSLAQEVVEEDRPEVVSPEQMAARPIAGILAPDCRACTALVVPLISEREALGALVLLRSAHRPAYGDEEVRRLRVFADMAALSLRRVLSQEEAELRLRQLQESESNFGLLVRSVRDYAIFMLDPAGRITSWNEGAQRITGYSEEEARGRHFSVFYPEEDRARGHPEHELRVAAREGTYQEEGWRVRRDGSRYWAHVLITALHREPGRLVGFAKVTRDLTERHRIEQELRESRERYRALYEDNPTIYLSVEPGGSIVSANRFGAMHLGYSIEELVGMPVEALIHPEDRSSFHEHLRACLEAPGEVHSLELRKRRRDGALLWMREAGRAVRGTDGSPVVLSACEDITDRVLAEQALRESEQRFRQIAENIREVFWISDPDYQQLFYVSPAYEEIWGRSVESVYADPRSFLEAVHPEDRARVSAALPRMGTGMDGEFRIVRPDGRVRWIHSRSYPVPDARGRTYRAVGVGEDITERMELLQRERNARDQVVQILESISDAFFALDREWRFTYLNPGARATVRAVLGADPSEAVGRSFWDVVPQFRGTRFEAEYRRAMESQAPVHFEEFSAPFGVWFDVHAYPSAAGLSVYFRDITERRRAEEERAALLRAEQTAREEAERRARDEEALRQAAEAVTAPQRLEEVIGRVASSALDATGADGAFVERFDPLRECVEVVAAAGERVPEIGSEVPYARSVARAAVERGAPLPIPRVGAEERELPGRLKHECGSCSAVAVPLGSPKEAIGALILLRGPDRPEFEPAELERAGTFARLALLAFRRAQSLEESERRRTELEQVMESRAHLMRGFSHDVKNPLGAADGYLELLQDGLMGELKPKQMESIGRVRRSIRSALALISDLVELARAESGEIDLHPGPLEPAAMVRELVEDFRAQAEAKDLELELEAAEDLPVVVTDGQRVRQVLGNLLSNAIKYTPDGGEIRVRATASRPDPMRSAQIAVSVRDTGPGIPPDKHEEIFREFTRLSPGEAPGAGLGLAISRRIARALGGDIQVDSEPGQGARFTLWLPAGDDG